MCAFLLCQWSRLKCFLFQFFIRNVQSKVHLIITVLVIILILYVTLINRSIPVAAWPKAWVCGCSLDGIAGSNPSGDIDFFSCECYVLSGRGLCDGPISRPEESYRVWCVLGVIYKPQQWGGLGLLGTVDPKNITNNIIFFFMLILKSHFTYPGNCLCSWWERLRDPWDRRWGGHPP